MVRRRSLPPALPAGEIAIDSGTVELEPDPDRPDGVMVYVNGVESSYVDLADPAYLEFEYMQQMMLAIQAQVPPGSGPRVMHLGGAACAFPRAVAATWPTARQLVVELDGRLAELARVWFALPRAPVLRIRVSDARIAVATQAAGRWDVVVRDVFAGAVVPEHVRTEEFLQQVSRVLAPGGLYLGNTVDRPPLLQARREVATALAVFRHVALAVEPPILRGRRFGNLVVVASDEPFDEATLARRLLTLPAPVRLVVGGELRSFVGTTQPVRDEAPQVDAPPGDSCQPLPSVEHR